MPLTVEAVARTHIGLVRRRNEDSTYAGETLFAVADGMGGHPAGDIASATVIEALRPFDQKVDPADLATVLGRAVYQASRALQQKLAARPELAGMGTTLVALFLSQANAVLANVGDSRAYLLRGTDMTQITEDHTYANLVADANDVPQLPARISRFLDGRVDGRSPDLIMQSVCPGDRFLLCSDGLSSAVPSDRIRATLSSPGDPGEIADHLINLAIDHGGPDNISVIVISVRDFTSRK